MATIFHYTLTDEETFETIFNQDNCIMNHVVMPKGKVFPKHPTDAQVFITVLRGELTVVLEEDAPIRLTRGQVANVPQGVESSLGNLSDDVVELMVLKLKTEFVLES